MIKIGKSSSEKIMHYSVGAIIKDDNKYLLIDRATFPFGFAGPAGHVSEGEKFKETLYKKIFTETGRKVLSARLLFEEEIPWNTCSHNVNAHYWKLYETKIEEGKVIFDPKGAKSIDWYSKEEIKKLNLEPVWEYWFKKLKVI